ncbi:MAG: hypothetical protein JNJ54_01415 [Myxococcaceae bacterium]|nr:hypothetical protein [Myxococcaceae bacterium]
MRRVPFALLFLCACNPTERALEHAPGARADALTVTQVSFVNDAGPIGLATQHQYGPTLVQGPAGETLVAWRDTRNFRFTGSDVYAARIIDGGLVDTLGVPLIWGNAQEQRPRLAFDGARYVLAWQDEQPQVFVTRLTGATTAGAVVTNVPHDFGQATSSASVAAGPGHTMVAYRHGIGFPWVAFLGDDGGFREVSPGSTVLRLSTTDFINAAVAAAWSEPAHAFYVAVPQRTGLYLARVDVDLPDGGLVQFTSQQLNRAVFETGFPTSGVDLAVGPAGQLGLVWRATGRVGALVLDGFPSTFLDAGVELDPMGTSAPSITWSGSRFRVAWQSQNTTTRFADLFIDGGVAMTGSVSEAVGRECDFCPPVVLAGTMMVSTRRAGSTSQGFDLSFIQYPEGSLINSLSGAQLTNSRRGSHAPRAAWMPDGGSALLVWSEVDENPAMGWEDVYYRRRFPSAGFGPVGVLVADAGSNASSASATWALDQWWVGMSVDQCTPTRLCARLYASPEQATNFAPRFNAESNSPPSATPDGRFSFSNGDRVVHGFLADGGSQLPGLTYNSAYFPSSATNTQGRILTATGERPNSGEPVWLTSDFPVPSVQLCNSAGRETRPSIATDGLGFAIAFSRVTTSPQEVRLSFASFAGTEQDGGWVLDGGLLHTGCGLQLSAAPIVSAPFVTFANDQYLITWSERAGATSPGRLRLASIAPDAGALTFIALDVGDAGSDAEPALAVRPGATSALLTWTRLDTPGFGAPVGHVAVLPLGAPTGTACSTGTSCMSGACVNNVCCDRACNGGCEACSVAGGGSQDGVCTLVTTPIVCRPAVGSCDVEEICVGDPTCPLDVGIGDGTACDGGTCMGPICVGAGGGSAGGGSAGGGSAGGGAAGGGAAGGGSAGGGSAGGGYAGGGSAGGGSAGGGSAGGGSAGGGSAGGGSAGGGSAGGGSAGGGAAGGGSAGGGSAGGGAAGGGAAAGGSAGGSSPTDAGTTDGGVNNVSHYSWSQGCGCGSTGAFPWLALVLLPLLRRVRQQRVRGATAALACLLVASTASAADQPPRRLRLIVPGIANGAGAKAEDAAAIGEFVQSRAVALEVYSVTGQDDIRAALGLDRQRQLMGCGDGSCSVELAGALDADRVLHGSLSKVGNSWLLTLSLSNTRTGAGIHRLTERFEGSLDRALDVIDRMLTALVEKDPVARSSAGPAPPVVATPAARHQFVVGVRAEAELLGLAGGQPAFAPAVSASWGHRVFGAAATVIILPTVGVRAEGRLHLLEDSIVRPLLALGFTLFGTAFAPRGAVGVTLDLGPVRAALDFGAEYFVSGPSRFAPLSLLASLGAGVRF